MAHGFAHHCPDPLWIDTSPAFLPSTPREGNRMAANGVTESGEGKNCWGMAPRECDSCKHSPAVLFCRADSAFLCGACDSKVHGANKLASRHARVPMCEVCEQAPAAVTCKADAAMLCISCDADVHSANPLARRHERFAVVPFYDSPSAALKPSNGSNLIKPSDDREEGETQPSWLLPDSESYLEKSSAEVPELKTAEYFFSDVDPYLEFDYSSSVEPRYEQTDSVVPVQTKNPVPALVTGDLDFFRTKPTYGGYSISSSDAGVVPDAGAMNEVTYSYGRANWLPSTAEPDREARLMRYREKKKSRKFEKTIRYASRKAYAEARPRVKGRFAKRTQSGGQAVYSSAADISTDGEYGVVPSF